MLCNIAPKSLALANGSSGVLGPILEPWASFWRAFCPPTTNYLNSLARAQAF